MSTSSKEKLRSLISILGQLDSGRKVTSSLLAQSIGVSERTIYRYLTTLQAAGYPTYYDNNKMSYRFADVFSLNGAGSTFFTSLFMILMTARGWSFYSNSIPTVFRWQLQ